MSSAFAAYRVEAPTAFTPPSAAALIAKAPRRPRRRALSVSVAALACTGIMLSGVAITQTMSSTPRSDIEAVGSDQPTSTDAVSQSTGVVPSGEDGSPTSPDPVEAELRVRTVSLPAWPGDLGEECPAGEFRFDPPTDGEDLVPPTDTPTPNGSWVLLPEGTHAKSTNLDGHDGDEVIVPVACGDVPGVIALSFDEEQFTSVAFVHVEEKPGDAIQVESAKDEVVTLSMTDGAPERKRLRHFEFDGETFNETDDPGDGATPTPTNPGGDGETPGESESPDPPPGGTGSPQPNDDGTTPPPDAPRSPDASPSDTA